MRRKKIEPDLFGLPPPQPRMVKPEPSELYDAVLRARFAGVQVFRVGRDRHLVRAHAAAHGKKITTAELLRRFPPGYWNPNR